MEWKNRTLRSMLKGNKEKVLFLFCSGLLLFVISLPDSGKTDPGWNNRAEEVLAIAETRLADEAESYADYLPEEAEKLRNAVAVQRGDVVAVAVCADPEKAAEQIWNYLD